MRLPGILDDVEAVAGTIAALNLARAHGGTMISISDAPGSALVGAIGQDAATALVKRVGKGKVTIPMSTARGRRGRQEHAAAMLKKGATVREAALASDVHERTVWRIKSRPAVQQQRDFFDRED